MHAPMKIINATILILAAATIYIIMATQHTDKAAMAFDATMVPPTSVAGLPEPRFFLDADAYAWMSHTRDMMAGGEWRLRHTRMDNAPEGRPMHWSHALIWPLKTMSSFLMTRNQWPLARAVELAAVWLMPLWLILFMLVFTPVIQRQLGGLSALVFAGLLLTVQGISFAFHPRQPDHHGLQALAMLGCFAGIQLALMNRNTGAHAMPDKNQTPVAPSRGWMLFSAFWGAVGLWLGATVWLFCMIAIFISGAALVWLTRAATPALTGHHWRWWSVGGVVFSSLFYLLEYAPSHFSMRLEVNHPLYWIFWLGLGEVAVALSNRMPDKFSRDKRPFAPGLLTGFALIITFLLTLFLAPPEWLSLKDPALRRLHTLYINEFQPGWEFLASQSWYFGFFQFGVLPFLALLSTLWLLKHRSAGITSSALTASSLALVLISGVMMLLQRRWGFFFTAALIWHAAVFLYDLGKTAGIRLRTVHLLAGVLLVNVVFAGYWRWHSERLAARADKVPPTWTQSTLTKRTAMQLGLAAGSNRWVMAGHAADAPAYYYFAGIRSLASFYWENTPGWHAETAFFSAPSDGPDAKDIARERSVTHVYFRPLNSHAMFYLAIGSPTVWTPERLERTMAGHLASGVVTNLPGWLRHDAALSALTQKMHVFRAPDGLVGEPTVGMMYTVVPDALARETLP